VKTPGERLTRSRRFKGFNRFKGFKGSRLKLKTSVEP